MRNRWNAKQIIWSNGRRDEDVLFLVIPTSLKIQGIVLVRFKLVTLFTRRFKMDASLDFTR